MTTLHEIWPAVDSPFALNATSCSHSLPRERWHELNVDWWRSQERDGQFV